MTTVAIDLRALADGSRYRGIGTYVRHVRDGLAATPGFELADGGGGRLHADVLFSPGLDAPRRTRLPWVQTVHDLIPIERPDRELRMARRRWRRHGPRLRRADAVIAVSRHVADRTIQRFGLDPARVHVVHHGVDPGFRPAPGRELSDPPYLLFVAAWGPHKGHAEAVEVVARLADAGYPHRLKIVGYEDAWMAARVRDVVGRGRHPERVDVVGWADELPALYQRATALVLTSRAEGFGLPAVEAMACGTPVVAFANTSLPEVVGDGGALVADGDVDAFVRDVRVLLDDERAWQEASARALARAARFDWGQSVAAHAEILRAVAEGHHR